MDAQKPDNGTRLSCNPRKYSPKCELPHASQPIPERCCLRMGGSRRSSGESRGIRLEGPRNHAESGECRFIKGGFYEKRSSEVDRHRHHARCWPDRSPSSNHRWTKPPTYSAVSLSHHAIRLLPSKLRCATS